MPNRKCSVCGCTDDHACTGGCMWVQHDPNICSARASTTPADFDGGHRVILPGPEGAEPHLDLTGCVLSGKITGKLAEIITTKVRGLLNVAHKRGRKLEAAIRGDSKLAKLPRIKWETTP